MDQTDQHTLNILLVEDNEDHAYLIVRSFGCLDQPVNITHMTNGVEALRYVGKDGGFADTSAPDLILLDLKLPRIGGHEVLKTIKSDPKLLHIPIVILTTSAAPDDRAQAYRSYANSYLVKPSDGEGFRHLARQLLDYWGNLNLGSTS